MILYKSFLQVTKKISLTSLGKFLSFPLNLVNLFLLISIFDKEIFAIFIFLEAVVGVISAGLFSSQNTILNRYFGDIKDKYSFSVYKQSLYLKIICFFTGTLILFILHPILYQIELFKDSKDIFSLLLLCFIYSVSVDLTVFNSYFSISNNKFKTNFLFQVLISISVFLALVSVFFLELSLFDFLFLRIIIPVVFFISFVFFFNSFKTDKNIDQSEPFLAFFREIASKQFPLMIGGFLVVLANFIPSIIFGVANQVNNLVFWGYLERVFAFPKNGITTISTNLYPLSFKNFSKKVEAELSQELLDNYMTICLISFAIVIASPIFYGAYVYIYDQAFLFQELFIFFIRFFTLFLIVGMFTSNFIFYSTNSTYRLASLNIINALIKSLNIFLTSYGLIYVVLIIFSSYFLPFVYSVTKIKNFLKIRKYLILNAAISTSLVISTSLFYFFFN